MSIQRKPDERDYRYLYLMNCRAHGEDEDELARRMGFTSAQDLYQKINEDGHPICPKCGATYVDETHCGSPSKRAENPMGKGKPKAKAFGEKTPLPPSEGAIPQFKTTLNMLIKDLEKLREPEEEYLQSKRFVATGEEGGKRKVWGARTAPPEALTTLIAIEALVAGLEFPR